MTAPIHVLHVDDDPAFAELTATFLEGEHEAYRTRLERQNELLEQFVGVVSHDLRSPLTVAQGRLELAAEECDSAHLTARSTRWNGARS